MVKIAESELDKLFEKAKKIKPRYSLTAEQMDELNEFEILGKPYKPKKQS